MEEIIVNPNSSGQGFCAARAQSPYHAIAEQFGYRYSHSTPIHLSNGRFIEIRHTYRHGEHTLSFATKPGLWTTSVSTASGRCYTGMGKASLLRHLAGKQKRYKLAA